ncbi:glutamate synthase [NADH] [Pseudocyphellaria aurata]|nr:glutamate synthase [NADH] [Pseudocyphellaria aurata]
MWMLLDGQLLLVAEWPALIVNLDDRLEQTMAAADLRAPLLHRHENKVYAIPAPPGCDYDLLEIEESVGDAKAEKKRSAMVLDKTKGFMKYQRGAEKYRKPESRTRDWRELSSRPFRSGSGCR